MLPGAGPRAGQMGLPRQALGYWLGVTATFALIIALAVALLVGALVMILGWPGPPKTSEPEDELHPDGAGPTGGRYPPGSNPAGPGAETQSPDELTASAEPKEVSERGGNHERPQG